MNTSKWMLSILALATIPTAPAAIITYNLTFDGAANFGGGSIFGTEFTSSAPTPKLNGTLAPGDTLSVVISAPAGMRFNVFPTPPGGFLHTLNLVLFTEAGLAGGIGSVPGNTIGLGNLSGVAPSTFDFTFQDDSAESFGATLGFFVGGPFSFTSLTADFDIPASYNRTFTDFTPYSARFFTSALFIYPDAPDPLVGLGSITRVPMGDVPEPSTAALAGGALAGLLLLRRRFAA